MGLDTKIGWCDHTWNSWSGCSVVSPGCDHCYAARQAARAPSILGVWGDNRLGGTRVVRVEKAWKSLEEWDRKSGELARKAEDPQPQFVFAHSNSDLFEEWDGPMINHMGQRLYVGENIFHWVDEPTETPLTMDHVRFRFFDVVRRSPNLFWLLLTKRPELVMPTLKRLASLGQNQKVEIVWETMQFLIGWSVRNEKPLNVGVGVTAENRQQAARRVPILARQIPAYLKFVSVEPMLEEITLSDDGDWCDTCECVEDGIADWETGIVECSKCDSTGMGANVEIDWVICGGESGADARPFDVAWARKLRDECKTAGVDFFMKQLGSNPVLQFPHTLRDNKGETEGEWPVDLQGLQTRPKVYYRKPRG